MADNTVSTPTVAAPGAPRASTTPANSPAPAVKKPRTTNDENEAIVHCMKAWNYAYKKEAADLDDDESDYPAHKAGNEAYLRAIPPLVCYENICEFIACINFAAMTDIITFSEAKHYRANAKLALTAVLRKPKPSPGPTGPIGTTNSTDSTGATSTTGSTNSTTLQPSKSASPEEK
jgi:hypothetical protein